MRICFISRRFFPAISGLSVDALNLLRELARLVGPAWLDSAALDRVGPLYGLYCAPGRHATVLISEGRLALRRRAGLLHRVSQPGGARRRFHARMGR